MNNLKFMIQFGFIAFCFGVFAAVIPDRYWFSILMPLFASQWILNGIDVHFKEQRIKDYNKKQKNDLSYLQ